MKSTSLSLSCQCLSGGHWIAALLLALVALPVAAADGDVDPVFNPNTDSDVYSTAMQTDGKIVIGGSFTNVAGATRHRIARLNADGTLDIDFNPNMGGGSFLNVYSTAMQADGKIVIGGSFTNVAGTMRRSIARLNADGSLDTGFDPGANAVVFSTTVQADGKIVMAGGFVSVSGTPRNRIARLNADGTLDTSFNPNANNGVYSTAVQEDGKIVIAGDFTNLVGTARNRIARLNADGTLDTSFDPYADKTVYSTAVQADGKIVIGGFFTNVNGTARNGIARLNTDGTLDIGFNPNPNSTVLGTALQADGKIVISGTFKTVSGATRNGIARLNANGSLDANFNPNANSRVDNVVLYADGKIVIGGYFTAVGGTARRYIARLLNGAATQNLNVPNATRVEWLRGGTAPETTQVSFELSSDGTNWTLLGSGTRISGGWELTGLSLPANGTIRARARTTGGNYNGSSGLVEQRTVFSPVPDITLEQPIGTVLVGGSISDFGTVIVGSSAVKTFTIKSTGSIALTGLAITIDGMDPADFTVSQLGVTTLAPGDGVTFSVNFSPTASGPRNAAIHIASNDSDENPFDIALAGLAIIPAPEIVVEQPGGTNLSDGLASVDFGNNLLGGSSQLTFTIRNTGNTDLTGLGITITGANASDFTVVNNPSAPVSGPAGSTTFALRFSPGDLGVRTASVQIASNDSDENPFDITVTGTGATLLQMAQQAYLKASNNGGGDYLGSAVAVSGDTVVIGAPREDSNASGVNGNQANNNSVDSGAVYVFVRNGTTWSQQAYIKASNPDVYDSFGGAVAISGDTLVVGATGEGSSTTGVNGNQADNGAPGSGAAYVFVRNGTTWSQQAYLKASNTEAGDRFGVAVSVSGNTVVIGANYEDSGATGVNGNQNDNSVSLAGAAYIFVRIGTNWTQQAYLKASNTGLYGDQFGGAVAISGDTVVVGAIFEDGSATGVNGPSDDSAGQAGAAYIFVRNGSNWSQQAYLKASNTGVGDFFGNAVAVSGDTVAVGAFGESSNAIGVNGNQSNNSSANSGAIYVFSRSGSTWSQQAYLKASNTGANDLFGSWFALSADLLVAGAMQESSSAMGIDGDQTNNNAPSSGAAYVFVRSETIWSQQAYVKASNTGANDLFGRSVAVSGNTAVIGAEAESSNAIGINGIQGDNSSPGSGAAYVLDLSGFTLVTPEIAIEQPAGIGLSDGSAIVNFRSVQVGDITQLTFTIKNTGDAALTGLGINITGPNAGDFTVSASPTSPLAAGSNTTFSVTFSAGATGARNAALQIMSNDSDESPFDITLTGTGVAPGAASWIEAWTSSTVASFPFNVDGEAFVGGDRGTWHIQDIEGEPTGNLAIIESISANKRLRLVCPSSGGLQASLQPLSIALTPDTQLAITWTGSLITPYWNGAFPTVFPPPGDNIHLLVEDNRGNMLVYLFTRAGNYPAHNTTIDYINPNTGQIVTLGYREVLVGAYDASGGTFIFDLFSDFSQVTGFIAGGASIAFIEFEVSGTASGNAFATMDDLKIGTGLSGSSATPPEIAIEQPVGIDLANGFSTVDFGVALVGGGSQRMFTIRNIGTAQLTNVAVTITGPDASNFTVVSTPASSVPGFDGTTTFVVTFTPSGDGDKSATLHILSNDSDESPFNITVRGTGVTPLQIAQQAYLKASNTGTNDGFGISVAVSGDTVVVGARFEDSNATGVNGNQSNNSATSSGAAYVFVRSGGNWIQQAYLKASNAEAGDLFGESVSVSDDTVVIGARGEDSNATGVNGNQSNNSSTDSGAAYVFVRSGTSWSQQAYLKASNTGGNDNFGRGVAAAGDALVVGAYLESSSATGVNGNQSDNSANGAGAAYVFVRSGTNWTQQAYLKASNTGTADVFGHPVAVAGDTVVVGAVLEASSATGVNGNQDDNSAPEAGAAYVFVRSGSTWSQQAYLKASNTGATNRFGTSVSVSGDTLVIGAPWENSNGTGVNNNQSDDSASKSGASYVFVRNGTTWSQQAYLKASNTETDDRFGESVAVSGDTIVVGALQESSNATGVNGNQTNNNAFVSGAAYVFARSGTNWVQHAYLKASNSGLADFFGYSVAVSGGTVVVGARDEDSNAIGVNGNQSNNSASGSGAAYIFAVDIGSKITFAPDGNGAFAISFNAVPGLAYRLQRATSVTGPWSDIATNTASASGLIEYQETNPPPGQAFYRTVQP